MNRRELLKRGFELGAAGLLLPAVEPIRRYWSLDRTMIPKRHLYSVDVFPSKVTIGDYATQSSRVDFSAPTNWVTSGYYVRALVSGVETLLPMTETASGWELIAPDPITVLGLQYTKTPVYAAS